MRRWKRLLCPSGWGWFAMSAGSSPAPATTLKGAAGNRPGRLSAGPQDVPWREDVMDDAVRDLWPRGS